MSSEKRPLWYDALIVVIVAVAVFVIGYQAFGTRYAVEVDSARTYGAPVWGIVADSTGALYVNAVWDVAPGTWDVVLFRADGAAEVYQRFVQADSALVWLRFPVADSMGFVYAGASLREVADDTR